MPFDKEVLETLSTAHFWAARVPEGFRVVERQYVEHEDFCITFRVTFSYDGEFYSFVYDEMVGHADYDWWGAQPDEIECPAMVPVFRETFEVES